VLLTAVYLTQLGEELRTNHPALKVAGARVDAATAAARGVRTWEDPKLYVGGMFAEEAMRAEDGDLMYGVRQELPLFGRAGLAREVARRETDVEATSREARFQFLRRDLAKALFQAALTRRNLEIGADDLRWLRNMVQSAEQRYQAAQGSIAELLRLQNEEAERGNRLANDTQTLVHNDSTLNRLLGRAETVAWPALRLPAVAGPVAYNERVIRLGLANEPRLKILRQEARQREATTRWTKRQRLPEVGVGLDLRNYTGTGEFRQGAAVLEFSFPWANRGKYGRDYDRDLARWRAVEHEIAEVELQVREELHM
jgi:outer membrane protein TolC